MPSTKWDGKKWSVKNYVQVLVNRQYFPVVLGSHTDAESRELCKALATAGIPYFSGVGKWNLTQTASVLAFSKGYFGSDTGLAHLAEAVGVPAHIVFGPTTPEMGFAPWRSDSLAIGKSLLCRPCSKDGRVCFRILNRYSCLKDLSAQTVLEQLDSNNKLRGLEQEQNDV
jgi:ADP-heptose:LPS heptosyltransferase